MKDYAPLNIFTWQDMLALYLLAPIFVIILGLLFTPSVITFLCSGKYEEKPI